MYWKNELTQLLRIDYPIIQAPMYGVSTPAMVAAAANAGCLGSLPLADLPAEKCTELIQQTKQLTNKPFAVNIFVHAIPAISDALKAQYIAAKHYIEALAKQHNLTVVLPPLNTIHLHSYHEQLDAIIAQDCKLVSFIFGTLDDAAIQQCKSHGIVLIGTCTSVEEAMLLEQSGVDIICAQGLEAGGHRGSFADEPVPKIGGLSLLPQVYDAVKVPLIYAGGIYDAKTLLAAKTLGGQGFQVGSLLLGSEESALQPFEKERLRKVRESEIILTKSFSGRYARGIKNVFTEAMDDSEFILAYPYQNKLTNELRRVSKAAGSAEFVSLWLGQAIPNFSGASTTEILNALISSVDAAARF